MYRCKGCGTLFDEVRLTDENVMLKPCPICGGVRCIQVLRTVQLKKYNYSKCNACGNIMYFSPGKRTFAGEIHDPCPECGKLAI